MPPSRSQQHRAHAAILDAMARPPALWQEYVLKGGLALQYAYDNPRRSDDLDFSALHPFTHRLTDEKDERLLAFLSQLTDGLAETAPQHEFARLTVARKSLSDEIPALQVWLDGLDAKGDAVTVKVKVEATLSERVCQTQRAEWNGIALHVPVLEDVLAEKLKSLVQQPPRDTVRSTDVFDLWYFSARSSHAVDGEKVSRFLQKKSATWPSIQPVTKARFHAPAVREHAAGSYEGLADELPPSCPLPPFDEAFAHVLRFVDTLVLPADAT